MRIPPHSGSKPAETIYQPAIVEAVEDALLSYGSIREWDRAAKYNLLMSILGLLSYKIPIALNPKPWELSALVERSWHEAEMHAAVRSAVGATDEIITTMEEDIQRLKALNDQMGSSLSCMQDDLRDLLDALGLFSGARAQSPHEVMRECIERVKEIRQELMAEREQ